MYEIILIGILISNIAIAIALLILIKIEETKLNIIKQKK